MNTKIRLSDIMEKDSSFNTSPSKNYIIKTPTGTGKTYFCIHTLLEQAWRRGEKILFLANRTAVIRQVKEQLQEFAEMQTINYQCILNSIIISTYQQLEEALLNNGNMAIFNKNNYQYVICDEAHYFVHDANFNTHTWLSFSWLTQKSCATTFFMSATIECIEERLIETLKRNSPYVYNVSGYVFMEQKLYQIIDNIPSDYSHIRPFSFDKIADIPVLLKKLHGRTVIFVSSIVEGNAIQNLLKNAEIQDVKFLSSEYRKNKEMNEIMQQLAVDECVEAKILITTAVIDNGINVKDKDFQNIFILTHTKEDLIQMLGRKRKVDDSPLNLFLCKRDSKYFYNIRKSYKDTRKVYDMYMNLSPQHLLQQYFFTDNKTELEKLTCYYNPSYNHSPFYGGLCFNPLSVDNLLQNIRNCNEIISRFETDMMAFVHMQLEWLDSSLIEELQDTSTETLMPKLVTLLESYKGKEMTAKEMGELIQTTFKNFIIALSKSHKYYKKARKMLDDAGFPDAVIAASNDLDEMLIHDLKMQGAKITSWGVGTNLITSKGCPSFGGVYKLAAIRNDAGEFVPKIKISENTEKITNPGNKTIFRVYDKETGKIRADLICFADETFDTDQDLMLFDPNATWKKTRLPGGSYQMREILKPIFINGECVYDSPSVMEIAANCRREKDTLWDETQRLFFPHRVYVDLSQKLYDTKEKLLNEMSK